MPDLTWLIPDWLVGGLPGRTLTGLAMAIGMLAGFGLVAIALGLRRTHPRLADALAALDPDPLPAGGLDLTARTTSERLGLWAYRHSPVPLLPGQVQLLELQRKPIAEFYADKLVLTLLGAALPAVAGALFASLLPGPVPFVAALAGAVGGWFLPDLLLRREAGRVRSDAHEALFTFFDLIILERLANRSATQSLEAASRVSASPLFCSIRGALDRARLEQRPPYAELRRLADRLRLPELADIADVMQLDESGAAVSDTLRARVRELRDAHLTDQRTRAHEVSERMTLWMALPAMVFGLVFLIPPLMRLLA
ncbi:type II secretion system F family protein [Mariniluteicoccus flavus]